MNSTRPMMRSITTAIAGGAALASVAYLAAGRHLRWGARREEVDQAMPGDDIVPDATHEATRAITIDAPVDYVWPWVAQLGQNKGGFYTYTGLENAFGCRMVNADRIVAEWQCPRPGEEFRLHPDLTLIVDSVEPGRALVVRNPRPDEATGPEFAFDFSWAFVVVPEKYGQGTRLLVRERYRAYDSKAGAVVAASGPVAWVMSVGMLRGIRGRAEQLFSAGV